MEEAGFATSDFYKAFQGVEDDLRAACINIKR
jgi:hypothetical protein